MAFWIAAGLLAAFVAALVLLAARRPDTAQEPTAAYDLRVYRDQLAELERDVARGTLTEEDATRARTEVSRRILEADRALQGGPRANRIGGMALIALGLIAMMGGSLWVYSRIGAPGYPDLPLQGRIAMIEQARENRPNQDAAEEQMPARPAPTANPDRLALVEQLRAVMADRPDDVQGLTLLAANEAMLGNFRDARIAQAHLIEVLGADATGRHYIDLAEMMIFAAGGYVSPEAEASLRAGIERAPRDGTGRFYAGQMFAQQGRPDRALPIWLSLLDESPEDAPWVAPIRAQIADIAFAAGVEIDPSYSAAPRGPSAADVEAMAALGAEDQQAMIETMVARLSDRLATEGGPPQDWAQLITAYGVLGRIEAAQIVLEDAQTVFADAPDALARIEAAFRAAAAQAGTP